MENNQQASGNTPSILDSDLPALKNDYSIKAQKAIKSIGELITVLKKYRDKLGDSKDQDVLYKTQKKQLFFKCNSLLTALEYENLTDLKQNNQKLTMLVQEEQSRIKDFQSMQSSTNKQLRSEILEMWDSIFVPTNIEKLPDNMSPLVGIQCLKERVKNLNNEFKPIKQRNMVLQKQSQHNLWKGYVIGALVGALHARNKSAKEIAQLKEKNSALQQQSQQNFCKGVATGAVSVGVCAVDSFEKVKKESQEHSTQSNNLIAQLKEENNSLQKQSQHNWWKGCVIGAAGMGVCAVGAYVGYKKLLEY